MLGRLKYRSLQYFGDLSTTRFYHSPTLCSNPIYLSTKCTIKPLIIKTLNSVKYKSLTVKYQRFAILGCQDLSIRKLEC